MPPPGPPRLKIESQAQSADGVQLAQFSDGVKISTDPLVSALEKVHLGAKDEDADNWIDEILDLQRPRKRVKQDQEELKRSLEKNFLTPSATFSPEWLNKLQQCVGILRACPKLTTMQTLGSSHGLYSPFQDRANPNPNHNTLHSRRSRGPSDGI
jgi:hypothetical protein